MRPALIMLLAASAPSAQGGGRCGAREGPSPMFSGPVIIQRVDPEYTDEALEAKIEGAVTVSGKIGTDGIPKDVTVAKGLGHGLNAKAVECSEKWRFQPAMRKGEPVEVRVSALVTFKLPAK